MMFFSVIYSVDKCRGRGGYADIEDDNGWAECLSCGGSGYKPTELGARILELVRHNSKLKVSAELRVSGVPS